MAALSRELIEVCLLRRGPQDLPFSPPAVMGITAGLLGLQLAFAAWHVAGPQALVARALVTLLMLFGATRALLRFRALENRAMQTLLTLALLLGEALLLFVLVPAPVPAAP